MRTRITDNLRLSNLEPALLVRFLRPSPDTALQDSKFEGELAEVLSNLEEAALIRSIVADRSWVLSLEEFPALVCLATEAQVKHELEGQELIGYLVDVVMVGTL